MAFHLSARPHLAIVVGAVLAASATGGAQPYQTDARRPAFDQQQPAAVSWGVLGGGGSIEDLNDGPGPLRQPQPLLPQAAVSAPQPYAFFPQGGTVWQDLVINNHVDLGSGGVPLDFDCTDRTYVGHRGHDADIVGFREQQIGVPIFAALDGVVVATHDGEADMNTQALGQAANYVILSHGNGQNSWYWHLKSGSVAVSAGQTVSAGTQVGLTGSSGSSTWPHLHFESQVDGLAYEPSAGPCRPGPSYWVNQVPVLQSTFVKAFTFANGPFSGTAAYPWDQVVHTGTYLVGTIATYFRMSIANYPLNGAFRITYTRPNGSTALDFPGVFNGSFRNGWLWFQMNPGGGLNMVGTWTARFYVNNVLVVTAPFEVVADSAAIVNHAPLGVSVSLDPPHPAAADVPFCRITPAALYRRDPDYDVVRYRYRWTVNGGVVRDVQTAGLSDAIPTGSVSSEDVLTCEVTPIDDYGVAGPSSSATNGPAMALDKSALRFGAVTTGAAFVWQTAAQVVRLRQSGAGTVTWTATPDQPWVQISPASGSGSADLSISVVPVPGLPIGSSVTGGITLAVTGASNTPGPIAVSLDLIPYGFSRNPFGVVDTPLENTTGVAGAVPFTGWALDDVEVTRVTVCRAAVGGEVASANPDCGGAPQIFLGVAVFIDGARPDVAAYYPAYPANTRAGWGFMVLTNMLPNQGNGTYLLAMYAEDREGHAALLGTRTMTCANASATKPFGAIDTPTQGGLASGSGFVNFGWALTPQPKIIPIDGSTFTVWVDGTPLGPVDYNHERVDIETLFPGFQNTAGTNGGVGFRILDTTTLTNGLHTIAWTVVDDAGAIEGIGSRFFTVSNGAGAVTAAGAASRGARALDAAEVRAIGTAPLDRAAIVGRRGWDLSAPYQTFASGASGRVVIRGEEVNRVELMLGEATGARYTGYLKTSEGLSPLPIGSQLDATAGAFTWAPGVGFVGAYDFVFVRWAGAHAVGRHEVRVILAPKSSGLVGPQVVIDAPRSQQDVAQPFVLGGWAADLHATSGTGIATVHAWAYPLAGGPPVFLGAASYGGARPDVAAVHGSEFRDSGFGLVVQGLPHDHYDLAVFAWSTEAADFVPAKVVRVTVR